MDESKFTVADLRNLGQAVGLTESDIEPIESARDQPIKADWLRVVRGAAMRRGRERSINQQDVIRQGLVSGLSNDAICDQVRELFPDSRIKTRHVAWTIHNERSKNTPWWKENAEQIAIHRDIQV